MTEVKSDITTIISSYSFDINDMKSERHQFSDLSWTDIASPLVQVEDGWRGWMSGYGRGPIGEGRRGRTHFADAAGHRADDRALSLDYLYNL